jgi:hypothetical protein
VIGRGGRLRLAEQVDRRVQVASPQLGPQVDAESIQVPTPVGVADRARRHRPLPGVDRGVQVGLVLGQRERPEEGAAEGGQHGGAVRVIGRGGGHRLPE